AARSAAVAGCVLVTAIARMPTAFAASMPAGAFSMTTAFAGATPRRCAARRKPSGSGLPPRGVFRRDRRLETTGDCEGVQHHVEVRPRRRGHDGSRDRLVLEECEQFTDAGQQIECSPRDFAEDLTLAAVRP